MVMLQQSSWFRAWAEGAQLLVDMTGGWSPNTAKLKQLACCVRSTLFVVSPQCSRLCHTLPHACRSNKQDKDGPKALDEFCRDLCEEVRQNKIDPVSEDLCTRVCVVGWCGGV